MPKDAKGHGSNARGGSAPLKGHPYHAKSNDALRFISKDAAEAARNMQGMGDTKNEGKYLDQVNDAQTILGYRERSGTGPVSDSDAASALAGGPKSASVPTHGAFAVGQRAHLGFGAKGGAGYFGTISKLSGGQVEIKHDNGKTYSGPTRLLS